MTTADAAVELHLFLWMITVVFAAGIIIGALTWASKKAALATLQATAFTAVATLATVRPSDPPDGQTGMGIPLMWVPFFVASWVGLYFGVKLARLNPR